MSKIFYVSYYAPNSDAEKRNAVMSATNKIDYICEALEKRGCEIEIVSASKTLLKKYCKARTQKLSEKTSLKLFASLPNSNRVFSLLNRIYIKTQMFFHLLKRTDKNSKVIVYHSLGYMSVIKLLKKIKGFDLIIEAEEVYGDVSGNEKTVKKEYGFFKYADKFIFPTEMFGEKVNTEKKPEVIVYGTYHLEEEKEKMFSDGKIHCVYAGTFDFRKGGAAAAIESALFLDKNYHIHILGFGNEKETEETLALINEVSQTGEAEVTYDGLLSGDEFSAFLQSCDVGFSTQNPSAAFNNTSFPSKILTYMANGMRVVSVRIPVVERSAIGKMMYYYDEQTPENIANAVKSIDFTKGYDSRKCIETLDREFTDGLSLII